MSYQSLHSTTEFLDDIPTGIGHRKNTTKNNHLHTEDPKPQQLIETKMVISVVTSSMHQIASIQDSSQQFFFICSDRRRFATACIGTKRRKMFALSVFVIYVREVFSAAYIHS
jgi:hypothetical protein